MGQSILKPGDLVKYLSLDQNLEDLGFVLGQLYKVVDLEGQLIIESRHQAAHLTLVLLDGELTQWCDHFAKHSCPLVLPVGNLQKRLGLN